MLTPTYKSMELYGSEYWTFFLPRRVGLEVAMDLTTSVEAISAHEAKQYGLVDDIVGRYVKTFK